MTSRSEGVAIAPKAGSVAPRVSYPKGHHLNPVVLGISLNSLQVCGDLCNTPNTRCQKYVLIVYIRLLISQYSNDRVLWISHDFIRCRYILAPWHLLVQRTFNKTINICYIRRNILFLTFLRM